MAPTKIRSHHLMTAKLLHKTTEEVLLMGLEKLSYISSRDDPFATFILTDFKNIFKNPNQEILIKEGGLDIICVRCPKLARKDCTPLNPIHKNFLSPYESPTRDREIIEKYKFDLSRTYTVEEIRNILDFKNK